jgi:hypothetical protein
MKRRKEEKKKRKEKEKGKRKKNKKKNLYEGGSCTHNAHTLRSQLFLHEYKPEIYL